jgi:GTP-binding protein
MSAREPARRPESAVRALNFVNLEAPVVLAASFVASADDVLDLPPPVFEEVAFAGKSNVGKSSLINALVGRRGLAHTSSTPGRTQRLNLLRVELRTGTLDLADLPGYGYAKVSKAQRRAWGPMIERFLLQRAGLRSVVVIIDVRRGLQDEDRQLLEFLELHGLEALLVATKIDKLTRSQRLPALKALGKQAGCPVLPFSAVTKTGVPELWQALLEPRG